MFRKHSDFHAGQKTRSVSRNEGSAIVAVLSVLALLSLLLVTLLHSVRVERITAADAAATEQSELAVESGVSSACALLMLATSNHPAFLVGLQEDEGSEAEPSHDVAPALVIGATNLTQESQMLPLFSCSLKSLASFPKLPTGHLHSLLEKRLSTNPSSVVDLNDPSLVCNPADTAGGGLGCGGIIALKGRYPALWQSVKDSLGKSVARYAFIMTDESTRLSPALHRGNPRTDPADWDKGAQDIPLSNGSSTLPSLKEALHLNELGSTLPTEGSFECAFDDPGDYAEKKSLLTRDPCKLPDLIPPGLPEAGLPKYNLNELATNPAWGHTPYDRALKIADIIDKNLPKFKLRDPSLPTKQANLYLQRIACSIVDYISSEAGPTGPPGGEPSGRDLVPYVTQIAERCTRTALTSNSVTIESRFFAEVWNPTTSTIPEGGIPRLHVANRARLEFGSALSLPFKDYDTAAAALPELRPNQFRVIAFDPVEQTWISPTVTTNPPRWEAGPTGNGDGINHQSFEFFWNERLVDLSRRSGISAGDAAGGLGHLGQTIQDTTPRWQSMTIPTWSAGADSRDQPDESEEAIQPGSYRFVGDPRATFLTAYKWNPVTNYPTKTLWKGISPAGLMGRGFVMDPSSTWKRRDRVPVNPVRGNPPENVLQSPDLIPDAYDTIPAVSEAPFVIRKGGMQSLAELGNIFDPAQADDLGDAPRAGSPKQTRFCCGGGRTLRIGQPEFHIDDPKKDWDVPGKRAVELLDLFTLADQGRRPETNKISTNAGIPGRINVNTAPHAVLTALFSGVAVTSDRRFTNCTVGAQAAEELALVVEQHRPYGKLSDLSVLTTNLVNAETYTPPLARNVIGSSPPVADVFDRAREEAFGKVIGHCVVQSRTFRLVVLGEALGVSGKPTGRALMEGIVRLTPDTTGRLIPSLHDVQWH